MKGRKQVRFGDVKIVQTFASVRAAIHIITRRRRFRIPLFFVTKMPNKHVFAPTFLYMSRNVARSFCRPARAGP
jgi:hypothetical protein